MYTYFLKKSDVSFESTSTSKSEHVSPMVYEVSENSGSNDVSEMVFQVYPKGLLAAASLQQENSAEGISAEIQHFPEDFGTTIEVITSEAQSEDFGKATTEVEIQCELLVQPTRSVGSQTETVTVASQTDIAIDHCYAKTIPPHSPISTNQNIYPSKPSTSSACVSFKKHLF